MLSAILPVHFVEDEVEDRRRIRLSTSFLLSRLTPLCTILTIHLAHGHLDSIESPDTPFPRLDSLKSSDTFNLGLLLGLLLAPLMCVEFRCRPGSKLASLLEFVQFFWQWQFIMLEHLVYCFVVWVGDTHVRLFLRLLAMIDCFISYFMEISWREATWWSTRRRFCVVVFKCCLFCSTIFFGGSLFIAIQLLLVSSVRALLGHIRLPLRHFHCTADSDTETTASDTDSGSDTAQGGATLGSREFHSSVILQERRTGRKTVTEAEALLGDFQTLSQLVSAHMERAKRADHVVRRGVKAKRLSDAVQLLGESFAWEDVPFPGAAPEPQQKTQMCLRRRSRQRMYRTDILAARAALELVLLDALGHSGKQKRKPELEIILRRLPDGMHVPSVTLQEEDTDKSLRDAEMSTMQLLSSAMLFGKLEMPPHQISLHDAAHNRVQLRPLSGRDMDASDVMAAQQFLELSLLNALGRRVWLELVPVPKEDLATTTAPVEPQSAAASSQIGSSRFRATMLRLTASVRGVFGHVRLAKTLVQRAGQRVKQHQSGPRAITGLSEPTPDVEKASVDSGTGSGTTAKGEGSATSVSTSFGDAATEECVVGADDASKVAARGGAALLTGETHSSVILEEYSTGRNPLKEAPVQTTSQLVSAHLERAQSADHAVRSGVGAEAVSCAVQLLTDTFVWEDVPCLGASPEPLQKIQMCLRMRSGEDMCRDTILAAHAAMEVVLLDALGQFGKQKKKPELIIKLRRLPDGMRVPSVTLQEEDSDKSLKEMSTMQLLRSAMERAESEEHAAREGIDPARLRAKVEMLRQEFVLQHAARNRVLLRLMSGRDMDAGDVMAAQQALELLLLNALGRRVWLELVPVPKKDMEAMPDPAEPPSAAASSSQPPFLDGINVARASDEHIVL